MPARLKLLMKLLVPSAIITYFVVTLEWGAVLTHLRQTSPILFAVGFILLCVRMSTGAWRSVILLKARGITGHGLGTLTRYYFIGNFFSLFMPALVGRDLARGYYLYRSSEEKSIAVSAVVVERLIGTGALAVMTAAAAAVHVLTGMTALSGRTTMIIGISAAGSALCIALLFIPVTERIIERLIPRSLRGSLHTAAVFIRDIVTFNRSPRSLWYGFAVSVLFQAWGVAAIYLLARAAGSDTPAIAFLVFLPVIWFAGMLPVSIGGLGVREGTFAALFATAGMTTEMALAICVLWNIQNLMLGFMGGILLATGKDRRHDIQDG